MSYGSYWGLWGITYLIRISDFQHLSRISFFGLAPAATIISNLLKLVVVSFVLFLAWRRRGSDAQGLVVTLAMSWLSFFIFAPRRRPAILCLVNAIPIVPFAHFLCLFHRRGLHFPLCFLQHHLALLGLVFWCFLTNALSAVWAPWNLLPWLTLIVGSVLIWRNNVPQTKLSP